MGTAVSLGGLLPLLGLNLDRGTQGGLAVATDDTFLLRTESPDKDLPFFCQKHVPSVFHFSFPAKADVREGEGEKVCPFFVRNMFPSSSVLFPAKAVDFWRIAFQGH